MVNEKFIKALKWLLFTAVISVIPLGLDWLFRVMNNKNQPWYELISAGQLFLISCALSASGLGESFGAIKRTTDNVFHHVVIGFLGILCIIATVSFYGYMSAAISIQQDAIQQVHNGNNILPLNTIFLAYLQVGCFIVSFIVGLYAQQFD